MAQQRCPRRRPGRPASIARVDVGAAGVARGRLGGTVAAYGHGRRLAVAHTCMALDPG